MAKKKKTFIDPSAIAQAAADRGASDEEISKAYEEAEEQLLKEVESLNKESSTGRRGGYGTGVGQAGFSMGGAGGGEQVAKLLEEVVSQLRELNSKMDGIGRLG